MNEQELEIIILTNNSNDFEICNKTLADSGYDLRNNFGKWSYNTYIKNYEFQGIKFIDKAEVFNPKYYRYISFHLENRIIIQIGEDKKKYHNPGNFVHIENVNNFKTAFQDLKTGYLAANIKTVEDKLVFSMINNEFISSMIEELSLKNPLELTLRMESIKEDYSCAEITYKIKVFNPKNNKIIKGAELFEFK